MVCFCVFVGLAVEIVPRIAKWIGGDKAAEVTEEMEHVEQEEIKANVRERTEKKNSCQDKRKNGEDNEERQEKRGAGRGFFVQSGEAVWRARSGSVVRGSHTLVQGI